MLANCYKNSLEMAVENDVKTIAFPSISTGAYNFPLERAAKIAVNEVIQFLEKNDTLEKIIFVCFDDKTINIYTSILTGK
jgi:O-acetyl-ADP-ribose deacetylase (regulator of RNase III)